MPLSLNPRKAPSQARSIETVKGIVEAAARIIEERGFERYTSNEIALRAGISIGSFYQYFPSKDAVTLSLIERETAPLVEEIGAALQIQAPKRAVVGMIEAAVRHQLRRPELARMLDFEETRLASELPGATSAAAVNRAVVEFFTGRLAMSKESAEGTAMDIMLMAGALTDAAGRRLERDSAVLERRIGGAVFGYLEAIGIHFS